VSATVGPGPRRRPRASGVAPPDPARGRCVLRALSGLWATVGVPRAHPPCRRATARRERPGAGGMSARTGMGGGRSTHGGDVWSATGRSGDLRSLRWRHACLSPWAWGVAPHKAGQGGPRGCDSRVSHASNLHRPGPSLRRSVRGQSNQVLKRTAASVRGRTVYRSRSRLTLDRSAAAAIQYLLPHLWYNGGVVPTSFGRLRR
jgi:hypothetical protein